MKSLHKITHSKRYQLRKQTRIDWIESRFWFSRLLSLLIMKGKRNFILQAYYITLFSLKFDDKEDLYQILSPLYEGLQLSVPLIGFIRVKSRRRRTLNPKWRPRIERPLRCFNLAFRWIRNLFKSISTRYLYERLNAATEIMEGAAFNNVLIQKFKHYELAIRFMNYLRVRRFRTSFKRKGKNKLSFNLPSTKTNATLNKFHLI